MSQFVKQAGSKHVCFKLILLTKNLSTQLEKFYRDRGAAQQYVAVSKNLDGARIRFEQFFLEVGGNGLLCSRKNTFEGFGDFG